MSAQHTPGPWRVKGTRVYPATGIDCICTMQVSNQPAWEEDARLIAAATDLLEALKGLLKEADDEINETSTELLAFGLTDPECPEHVRRQLAAFISARAAIAKATGAAP